MTWELKANESIIDNCIRYCAAWWHPLPSWQLQWASHVYLALKAKELWVRPALSQGWPRRNMAIAFFCVAHDG